MEDSVFTNRVRSYGTSTPGRCLNQVRSHHFVIDERGHADGPGEEITPAEAFLAGVSACGVLLVETQARKTNVPLTRIEAVIDGIRKKSDPTMFDRVEMQFTLVGPNREQAEQLVEHYKNR
jgi:uncharacterized OsmC-like protein